MLNRKPNSKQHQAMMVPKPGNGTPKKMNFNANTTIVTIDRTDSVMPESVMSVKRNVGVGEDALEREVDHLEASAHSRRPPKRGARSISMPIDLKPTQANRPRTKRFRSSIVLIVSYTLRSTSRKSLALRRDEIIGQLAGHPVEHPRVEPAESGPVPRRAVTMP